MNILYIHTHDTGRVISSYGYQVLTPNYQTISEDSLLFQNAHSVAPTCSPSRSSLMTGTYPHQNGMLGLAQRGFSIKKEEHLTHLLQKNGFHNVLCGVQHEVGYYLDHELAVETFDYHENLTASTDGYSEAELVFWDQKNAENLCQWLQQNTNEKPFFISYGMHATHRKFPTEIDPIFPIDYSQPPLDILNTKDNRIDYAQFKTSLKIADENLGEIIETLKKKKLYDQTIIILSTDHGLPYPFHKCNLTDSGTGVLLTMRVPQSKQLENSFDGLISQIDIIPTLCDLLEIEKPDYLEGKSFAHLFQGQTDDIHDTLFAEVNFHTSYEPIRSVRTKRFKYIKYFDDTYHNINFSNIDSSPIKEFLNQHQLDEQVKDEEYLFDLYYDPTEKNNLIHSKEYQETLLLMRQKLHSFMSKTKDPLLNGPIPIKKEWKVNKANAYTASSKNPDDYHHP
ncbi:sulfatase family protein [Enterococcus sp.]|uniref:sulfatase family protein n=1 Tax=Enterococcus sp. TaxID=35783 RepID=UPI002FC59365